MRALLIALVLILAPATASLADNDVGCGVGTEVWKGQKGLVPHLLASMTNGIAFNSISLTFGLINCDPNTEVTVDAQLKAFASTNIDRLARETAAGGGAALDVLAALYGVVPGDSDAFAARAQGHFGDLFATEATTADEMLTALDRMLARDEKLAHYARS